MSGSADPASGHGLRMALLFVLTLFGVYFFFALLAGLRRVVGSGSPASASSATPSTAMFRAWRLVPDELIPGTLNVGHTITSVLSAFVFIELVPVSASTLLSMIAAAGLGAWLGAGIVARLPRYRVRLGMGGALLVAAGIMLLTQLGLLPGGADALGLSGVRLAVAVAGNFVLGGLMTLGVGLYAPCMILISLLGMNPRAAFPIMMGSCAFLMPISGTRFVREGRFHPSASLGLTLGGIPALLIAAYLVKALPVSAVRWIVIAVVLYTALTLLEAGRREIASLRAAPE